MKGMKRVAALVLAASMVLGSAMTSMAASWQQNATGWWWQNDDGTWPANEWRWLDGNNDGVAECYYFDSNGYMAANTTTPDGYQVNADGAWVVNGAVQTQTTQPAQTTNTDVITGYNSDGISNAAIDILNHTQAENAKYGEIQTYEGNGSFGPLVRVWYSNGLIAEYYTSGAAYHNGLPDRVYTETPNNIIKGIDNSISNAEQAESNLENNGFANTYNDGINTWTVKGVYYILWLPSAKTLELQYAD